MTNYNKLTNAETERLAILSEECGEVVRIIGKIFRHEYESYHPKNGAVNRDSLMSELGDLANIIDMMVTADDINIDKIEYYQEKKAANMYKWLRHQGEDDE